MTGRVRKFEVVLRMKYIQQSFPIFFQFCLYLVSSFATHEVLDDVFFLYCGEKRKKGWKKFAKTCNVSGFLFNHDKKKKNCLIFQAASLIKLAAHLHASENTCEACVRLLKLTW